MHEPSDSSRKKIYSFGEPVAERKQFCINVETAVPSRLIVIFREVRFDSRIKPERRAMAQLKYVPTLRARHPSRRHEKL
jgi:hypothetical protein